MVGNRTRIAGMVIAGVLASPDTAVWRLLGQQCGRATEPDETMEPFPSEGTRISRPAQMALEDWLL